MKTPVRDLIEEHQAISVALNIIEQISTRCRKENEINTADINDLLGFLKVFADHCHHGKEENYLFPALEKAGIRKEGGPIGFMLRQHDQGRSLIGRMEAAVSGDPVDKAGFADAATEYVNLMRAHIGRENTVLFPAIEVKLSAAEQLELQENFENHENEVIGEGRHEELHALLERLSRKYPG